MILEGIVTTLNADGSVNISPMGPEVSAAWASDSADDGAAPRTLVLKPYQTSTTYQNLKRAGQGVFHVTDDVELLARAAVDALEPLPVLNSASDVEGMILADACRWYAFRVGALDDSQPRTRIECRVVASGRQRDFFGFNRAKHAVLEAAILATRVEMLPAEELRAELARLRVPVDKTGGPAELRAFAFLESYVRDRIG
jgi:uncharacterized protein